MIDTLCISLMFYLLIGIFAGVWAFIEAFDEGPSFDLFAYAVTMGLFWFPIAV